MNNFLWLEQWYLDQCNGTWEHTYGVHIDTLDSSGWRVRIDLRETPYDGLPNAILKQIQANDRDWMTCHLVASVFEAHGGPLMLGPIIQTFRSWIETVGL